MEDVTAEETLVQQALSQDKEEAPPETGLKAKRKLITGF